MGDRDSTVRKIIGDINAARAKKKSDDNSAAASADAIFGGIGKLIEELQPELVKKFPDLAPEVSLGPWVQRSGGIETVLKLKRNGKEKEVTLACQAATVRVGRDTIPSKDAQPAIIQEIVGFFTAD
jgi:hypothetical protein